MRDRATSPIGPRRLGSLATPTCRRKLRSQREERVARDGTGTVFTPVEPWPMSTQHLAGVVVEFMLMVPASRLSRATTREGCLSTLRRPDRRQPTIITVGRCRIRFVRWRTRMLRRRSTGSRQRQITFGFLGSIPQRGAIHRRLTELWDYEKYTPPFREGGATSSRIILACKTRSSCTRATR